MTIGEPWKTINSSHVLLLCVDVSLWVSGFKNRSEMFTSAANRIFGENVMIMFFDADNKNHASQGIGSKFYSLL